MKFLSTKLIIYSPYYGKDIDKENELNTEDIDGFTKSIKENGIMVPINVRPIDDGKFQVLAGNRRLNAAKVLRMQEVPVIVWKGISEIDAALFVFTENTIRRKLSPKQIAMAIGQVYETVRNDDGTKMTLQQASNNIALIPHP